MPPASLGHNNDIKLYFIPGSFIEVGLSVGVSDAKGIQYHHRLHMDDMIKVL